MRSPFAKLSMAAAVVVVCSLILSLWTGTGSVALADVLARVQRSQTFRYKTKTTEERPTQGTTVTESIVLVSNEYGMKVDQTTTNPETNEKASLQSYLLPAEKKAILIRREQKQYGSVQWDDATLTNAQAEHRDPRVMLERLLNCKYRPLDASRIDGREVQGFETTDPAFLAGVAGSVRVTFWVDAQTWLPVRSETEMELRDGGRASAVEYDYEWDVVVSAADFQPDIPADFTTHEMSGMKMPSYGEQGFIEALRLVAELTGRYPESLGHDMLQNLSLTIGQALRESDSPAAQQFREGIKNAGSREAALKFGQEYMMRLTTLSTFQTILARQGKEPVYHGDVVTPKDIELPLLRWKASDTEYRVLFGDLHAATVDAKTLANLEAALPQ